MVYLELTGTIGYWAAKKIGPENRKNLLLNFMRDISEHESECWTIGEKTQGPKGEPSDEEGLPPIFTDIEDSDGCCKETSLANEIKLNTSLPVYPLSSSKNLE